MTVFLADEQAHPVDGDALADLAARVLRAEGYPEQAEVSVFLVDDDVMAARNEAHLGRSGPTDVLSFPLEHLVPGRASAPPPAGGPPLMIGDVLIAPGYVARQARELGVPESDELALMVVHGVLHLLGYDHEEDADAELMEGRERAMLSEVGVTRR